MAPHAHKQPLCFDPVIDTDEWRRAQKERLLAFAKEIEAERGPFDPEKTAALEAKWTAQLEAIEAKFTEDEPDA